MQPSTAAISRQKAQAIVVISDATDVPVYAPVAVAADGTVNEWSADAYDTLYVVSGKPVTLRPAYKLKSVVSGGEELNYNDGNSAVSFYCGHGNCPAQQRYHRGLVIEADGFPKGRTAVVYGARATAGSFDPVTQARELFTNR